MKTVFTGLWIALAALTGIARAETRDTEGWAAEISAADARRDLAALYDGLQSAHVDLFANRAKEDYDARFASDMAALRAPLSKFELFLRLQKFTAFGNVAHATIAFPAEVYDEYRAGGGKAFPIYLRFVDGRAIIDRDYSGVDAMAPGDEILAIDGVPMAEWLARTSAHISADTPYIAQSLLEFYFPMYLWVELGARETYDVRVRASNGDRYNARIPARSRDEQNEAAATAPEVFSLDASARDAHMINERIAYLRPGPFYNAENPSALWDNSSFAVFIDDAFAQFLSAGAEALVIDIRQNPGGDNSFSDLMIAWIADRPFRFASEFLIRSSDEAAASNQARLDANPGAVADVSALLADAYARTPRGELFEFDIPLAHPRAGERFNGEVYVLIDRHSYSNAVNTAAIFQDYGWGVIAGEKTTDMATTFGAMERFSLPVTGIEVGFPKAHIIRPSGDRRIDGVTPDIAIAAPLTPTTGDEVLRQLVDLIEARAGED